MVTQTERKRAARGTASYYTILYHNISYTHIVIFTATFYSKPLYGINQCITIIESVLD